MNKAEINYTAGIAGTYAVKYYSTNCDRDYVRFFNNEEEMNRWMKKVSNVKIARITKRTGIGKSERIY